MMKIQSIHLFDDHSVLLVIGMEIDKQNHSDRDC